MPNIDAEINNFKNAVLGEEVRGSLISLALKMNGIFDDGNESLQEGLALLEADLNASTQAIAQALACIAECNEILGKLTGIELTSDEALALAQRMTDIEEYIASVKAGSEEVILGKGEVDLTEVGDV